MVFHGILAPEPGPEPDEDNSLVQFAQISIYHFNPDNHGDKILLSLNKINGKWVVPTLDNNGKTIEMVFNQEIVVDVLSAYLNCSVDKIHVSSYIEVFGVDQLITAETFLNWSVNKRMEPHFVIQCDIDIY